MLNLRSRKSRLRVIATTGLLVLFAFTSLFAVYQNGKDITAAYASSSDNNTVGAWDCIASIATCVGAITKGIAKCTKHGWDSKECMQAAGLAAIACADVPGDCGFVPNMPQIWIDNGWV